MAGLDLGLMTMQAFCLVLMVRHINHRQYLKATAIGIFCLLLTEHIGTLKWFFLGL